VESPKPREAAEILAAIKGRDARTAPARTLRRGTPESKQHRVTSSSAPAFTLTAKARTAYHFIAFSAEACRTWRLYHGAAGMDAGRPVRAKERILALATWSRCRPWFLPCLAPTFVATYSLCHIPEDRIGAEPLTTEPLHRLWHALSIGALLALLIVPAATFAQEAGEARQMGTPKHHATPAPSEHGDAQAKPDGDGAAPSEEAKSDAAAADLLPPPVITHHNFSLDGADISYNAKAGMLPLRDAQDKTTANIFYVAYWREPQDTKRPVTFVFNGGPGAASAYLHLGAIGPKTVEVSAKGELLGPPPRLASNDASWLDFTDLVFVDPVGTGYSRASGGKSESDFFGVEQDTQALADFIRLYLTDAARMTSPVFLAGESYGGFRAATITRALQKTGGISPSGLVLISPALEFALLSAEDYDPLPWALTLPSFAAVNLESKGVSGREALAGALQDAERYALSDYLVALASGAAKGSDEASAKVAELTGLPPDVVRRNFARIPPGIFIKIRPRQRSGAEPLRR
jgi:hypothetical protein